ncbi:MULTISPECIES: hypothetical protein [Pseudomonas]|uniref:SGNH/GDSL hydrolase family protein n=1 Tax=Pseudomonas eucalypticola TaxID=2599595 RepID=A0A7D5HFB2_9PSED|nr:MULTISPECIES: hypothetical protein [Pseudomonas]QKZ06090.1 hypothetical protein HWQ56_20830 [Pseudomonas eucalypticola]
MNLYIVGDSHTLALSRGLEQLKEAGQVDERIARVDAKFLYPGYRVGTEFYQRTEDVIKFKGVKLKNKLKALTGRRHIAKQYGDPVFAFSSGFYHRGLIETMLREGILPWHVLPDVQGVRRISMGETKALVHGFNEYLFRFFKDLQDLGIRFFLVAPPGPRLDDRVGAIAPALHGHLALDPLFRTIVQQWYDDNDIPYLSAPLSTLNSDHSLRAEYYERLNGDDHHASTEYGRLMSALIIQKAVELYGEGRRVPDRLAEGVVG